MDAALKRTLLVLGAIATGTFAGFYLWAIGSQYTYAALIPAGGGLLLAVPAATGLSLVRPRMGQALGVAAWLALAAAIVLGAEGPRPVAYFWLVGAAVGLFLLSAVLHPRHGWHAAAGLTVLFLLVRWSSYHAFATFAGSDAFRHMRIIEAIILNEQMPSVEVAGKYAAAPGFHLVVAATRMVTGLGRSDAMFWAVAMAQLALPLAVYALARRWGRGIGPVAAVAVLATESSMILAGIHPIPGGVALALLVPLLVGLLRSDMAGIVLLAVAGLAGVLTHHLTIVVSFVFVGGYGGWLAVPLFRGQGKARDAVPILAFFLLAIVFVVVHGVIAPREGVSFFDTVIDNLSRSSEEAAPGAGEARTLAENRSAFSGILYKATLVLGSSFVVAAGARLVVERGRPAQAVGAAGLILLLLAFALPFLGFDLVQDRWMPVIFSAGLLGMGALVTSWSGAAKVGLAIGLVAFALLGITQPAVTHDHFFYSAERNVLSQFNEQDIESASLAGSGRQVYTDVGMVHLLRVHGVRAFQLNFAQNNGTEPGPQVSLIVLRADLYEQGRLHFELFRGTNRFALDDQPSDDFVRRLELTSRVLDTGAVRTYAT